jgi:hypothetical protein
VRNDKQTVLRRSEKKADIKENNFVKYFSGNIIIFLPGIHIKRNTAILN